MPADPRIRSGPRPPSIRSRPRVADQSVSIEPSIDVVVAGSSGHVVAAVLTEEHIVSLFAKQPVVSAAPQDGVVAAPTTDAIVPSSGEDDVVARSSEDDIVAVRRLLALREIDRDHTSEAPNGLQRWIRGRWWNRICSEDVHHDRFARTKCLVDLIFVARCRVAPASAPIPTASVPVDVTRDAGSLRCKGVGPHLIDAG